MNLLIPVFLVAPLGVLGGQQRLVQAEVEEALRRTVDTVRAVASSNAPAEAASRVVTDRSMIMSQLGRLGVVVNSPPSLLASRGIGDFDFKRVSAACPWPRTPESRNCFQAGTSYLMIATIEWMSGDTLHVSGAYRYPVRWTSPTQLGAAPQDNEWISFGANHVRDGHGWRVGRFYVLR
jgi:hypothetical protein